MTTMNDKEFKAKLDKRRRLWETPIEQWSNEDLIESLSDRYTPEPVPPCRVCGGELSVQSIGGGNATVWGCSGTEDDPDRPGHVRYKEGRRVADDHYAQSTWTQHREGDSAVLEMIRRQKLLQTQGDALTKRVRELEAVIDRVLSDVDDDGAAEAHDVAVLAMRNVRAGRPTYEGLDAIDTDPASKVQMPDRARAGIEALHYAVEQLLTTGRYVDEEGEATAAMADLLSCIAEPEFQLKATAPTLPHVVRMHIADLRRAAKMLLAEFPALTPSANEFQKAADELETAMRADGASQASACHTQSNLSAKPLLDALERISKRCPTDHADYTTASIGDTARNGLAAYGAQPSAASEELTSLLRIWQSHLGASREQCDESGQKLWDRIESVLCARAAPTLPPLTKLQAEFTFSSGRSHTLVLWGTAEHIDALQLWLLRTAGEALDGAPMPQIEPAGYVGDLRDGASFFLTDPDDVGIAIYTRPQLHAVVQEAMMVANAREGRQPGFVLLPAMPEGRMRETLLRALEDAGPSEWVGTVKGAAGQLYDALIRAARALTTDVPHPVFASGVARRKWESLQGDGYRMQRIEFSRDDGKRGTIDPWGKVLWLSSDHPLPLLRAGVALATSNGVEARYEVRFSFPTLHEMQAAHNEWIHFAAACRGVPDPADPKR